MTRGTSELTSDDIVRISQVEVLYGHVLDDRRWDLLGEVFTEDAVYDLTAADFGGFFGERHRGLTAIRALFERTQHALAHHASNIYVYQDGNVVRVASKFFAPGSDGMICALYDDTAVQTSAGWRLSARSVVTRRLTSEPGDAFHLLH